MRLAAAGTPGQPAAQGSVVHFQHFREWRLSGVAHELRDCSYVQPNRSLLSTALGRTKEFKDRCAGLVQCEPDCPSVSLPASAAN
jgi:hypothetical protein